MSTSRVVRRGLRYAWLEYEDARDGIAFDRAFSSAEIGGRNIFLDLPTSTSDAKARVSANVPDLTIRWQSHPSAPGEEGLIALPTSKSISFLEQWILNPGVQAGQLTYADTEEQADLLVVSGHGGGGDVFGKGSGSEERIALGTRLAANAKLPCSGRLKYLLIPSCSNCSMEWAHQWLPILGKEKPVHGVFGFSGKYPGDAKGAEIMRSFAATLKANPAMSLLDAWVEVNTDHKQDWGAIQLLGARDDTLLQWKMRGLRVPSDKTAMHYDQISYPSGTPALIPVENPRYQVRFMMQNGRIINRFNNVASNVEVGLFPGMRGNLVIRADSPQDAFQPDAKVTVLFYYWRAQKIEMDLDKLLTFDKSLFQNGPGLHARKLVDANPQKDSTTGRVDGIEVSGFSGQQEVRLPYVISSTAKKNFKEDPNGMHTHGFFALGLYAPGPVAPRSRPSFYSPVDGAFLR